MKHNEIQKLDIQLIKPYGKNMHTGKNVELLKQSIQKFGYNSYIIVDADYIIICWHSRYTALLQLWYTEIDVIVLDISKKEAQKLRIIDNRTAQLNTIDDEALRNELRTIINDNDFIRQYFNEIYLSSVIEPVDIDLHSKQKSDNQVNFEKSGKDITGWDKEVELICPECLEVFTITTNLW